jgi:hypothetical protein
MSKLGRVADDLPFDGGGVQPFQRAESRIEPSSTAKLGDA